MNINDPRFLALQADVQIAIAKNANTVDSALGNRGITTNAVAVPETFFSDLNGIGRRARMPNPAPGVQQVPITLSNTAAASNPTNFQLGDTTLDNIAVTVAHICKPAYLSRAEQGHSLANEHVTASLIRLVEQDIVTLVTTAMTTANFGATDSSVTTVNFDETELQVLIGACGSKPRTLLIPNAARAGIVDSLMLGPNGWQYPGIETVREVTATLGDAHTVLASPEALAFIVEKPEAFNHYPPGELQIKEIVLPTLNIPAWHVVWIDRATRSSWQSIELLFGVSPANVNALSYASTP